MKDGSGAGEWSSGSALGEPLDPRSILTSIGEVVYDWDIASDRLVWGLNVREVLAFAPSERIGTGRAFRALVEPGSGQSRDDAILSAEASDAVPGASGAPYRTHYVLRTKRDRLFAVEDTGRWFAGADGRPSSAHGVLRVEPLKTAAQTADIGTRAARDRARLVADLGKALAEAAKVKRPLTLMLVAIEELAEINDGLGYEATDAVIEAVVARLSSAMRRRDVLARYAGNRFALVLASCPADQVETAASRFLKAADMPVDTPHGPLAVRLALGAVVAPQRGGDPADIMRQAEEALAVAKRRRGGFAVHSSTPGGAVRGSRTPGLDLVAALNERRVRLARQPVVEARSRRTAFEEGLVRIARLDGSLATAAEIVPAAERLGLVRLVDHRMLELAVDCLAREPGTRLAINASAMTLDDPDWLTAFAAHLGAHKGVADRLIVEITETVAVANPDATRACLNAMKALGVGIAIDDFGAGHTSFRHLRNFPVDIVKIDGAFVQNLTRSTDDRFFVRTLVDLAQHLGIATVAEWVESEETGLILADWGVDYLQGDAISGAAVVDEQSSEATKVA